MNRVHITLSRIAVGLVVALGATTPTLAAVCNNVTFSFTNGSAGPLQITEVRYRDLDSADTERFWVENVANFSCPSGDTCETAGDNLGSVTRPRRNHELTDIQFHHQHLDEFGNWQNEVWGASFEPDNKTCENDRNYGPYALHP